MSSCGLENNFIIFLISQNSLRLIGEWPLIKGVKDLVKAPEREERLLVRLDHDLA